MGTYDDEILDREVLDGQRLRDLKEDVALAMYDAGGLTDQELERHQRYLAWLSDPDDSIRRAQLRAYRRRRRTGHYDRAYRRSGRRDWLAHSRMLTAEYAPPASSPRPVARQRAARRPRAAATRSSSRSGDSGSSDGPSSDDGPAAPASAGRPPSLAPLHLTLRQVRSRIVADLLQEYPPRGVRRWLTLIGWSPTAIEQAFSDAAASRGAAS